MKYKNIIFDLDGTLTDSGPGIRNGVSHALKRFGIGPKDTAFLNKFIGPPLFDSFVNFCGIPPEEAVKGEAFFREYYQDKGIFENSLYDGIYSSLEKLYGAGLSLYIATSKPEFMAVTVAEHFGIKKFFRDIRGSVPEDGLSDKKDVIAQLLISHPEILKNNSVMVGDRKHDILGAKAHNIPCITVLWGYGSQQEFLKYGSLFSVDSPDNLAKVLLS